MIITVTDFKLEPDKYLELCQTEEVIITSNGKKIARLTGYIDFPKMAVDDHLIKETAGIYEVMPRKVSYEEFLEISENSEERYEYIDGEIYLLASPKTVHQEILGELYGILWLWFKGKKCRPMLAPYDITLRRNVENINVVQPDLMVICDLEEKVNGKGYYMGVPVLLVEIISESTRRKDFMKKLDLYRATGVKEYWMIDPDARKVHVYLFHESSIRESVIYKDGETLVSFCFEGLEVSLEEVFNR